MLYIILAILIFGVLIATHELGHFATAKLLGVKVNEFSIGMGPAVFKREKGDTLYSVRLLPVGGYCAMEGEDDDSADPRAFGRAAAWKKIVILCAGAAMNFLTALLLVLILYLPQQGKVVETYGGPIDGYGTEHCGLEPGDRFLKVDGHAVLVYGNARLYLDRAGDTVDFVVERSGETVRLDGVELPRQQRTDEKGNVTNLRGITVGRELEPLTLPGRVVYAWDTGLDFVRLVWLSLGDLVRGAVGLRDLSGPVGIVDTMTEAGSSAQTPYAAFYTLTYFTALIAANLAVMNLLPLPALDGGRVLFLVLNGVLYGLFRKKIPPEYEGYVHMAGLAALMALMVVVTLSDVGKLLGR